jgi:hypothetical protein
MEMPKVSAYAHLNARIMPLDRGEQYEDPLGDALEANGYGAVTGGGTLTSKDGEVLHCGIDIDLADVERGAPFVREFLTRRGAPRGSRLEYERAGERVEEPFGVVEGLAIYLNGTELPAEVYAECDINEVYDEVNRLLGDRGGIANWWQGPTETALYLYGASADEMRDKLSAYMAATPIFQRSRLVVIA